MALLDSLLDPGFRQAASVVVTVGNDERDLGGLAALVASIDIVTSRTEAATGSIVIEDRRESDGRWMAADSGLFERWAPITVCADFQTHQEEIVRGYISKLTPDYPNMAGEAKLTLELQDESAALSREHMREVWGQDAPVTDLTILNSLIAPLGLSADPASGQGASSRALTQDASPIQFLRERARANGYELIFSEGVVYFGPYRLDGEPQAPILVYAGRGTNCRAFSVNDDAMGADTVRIDMAPRESGAATEVESFTPDLAVLGTSPVSAEGANLGTASVARVSREGDETPEEARARAQGMVNDSSFRLRASGELEGSLYGHVLKVGRPVSVDGAGARYGGIYYVDKVSHSFTPENYRQVFELMRNATGESDAPGTPLSSASSAISGLFAGVGF